MARAAPNSPCSMEISALWICSALRSGRPARQSLRAWDWKAAQASWASQTSKPRLAAIRMEVEIHCGVDSPAMTRPVAPSLRRRVSRSVPMKAELVDFSSTGSSPRGATIGFIAVPPCVGCSGLSGRVDMWRTWMTGCPQPRKPARRRAALVSASGLLRAPQSGLSMPVWMSIRSSARIIQPSTGAR